MGFLEQGSESLDMSYVCSGINQTSEVMKHEGYDVCYRPQMVDCHRHHITKEAILLVVKCMKTGVLIAYQQIMAWKQ